MAAYPYRWLDIYARSSIFSVWAGASSANLALGAFGPENVSGICHLGDGDYAS